MAKHRLEQPNRGSKVAKRVVIAGSITVGSLAAAAGPALAAPVTVPGLGTFEVPGFGAPAPKTQPVKKQQPAQPAAQVQVPNLGTFTVPGLNPNQIPDQFKPHGRQGPTLLRQTTGEKALAAAETKIGSPYSYGSAGPNAFDCSGLVYWSYKQAGKTIPRDSYGQLGGGRAVSLADAQPGDVLIFNGGGHAGIYIGNGKFIHAQNYGVPVKRDVVKEWALTGIRRY